MDVTKTRFFIGTSRGVLLCTGDKPNDVKVFKNEETTEVTVISKGRNTEEIILGFGSGNAHLFNTENSSFIKRIDNLEGGESVSGIFCNKKSILLAKRDGVINIWTKKKNNYFSLNLNEAGSLDAMVSNSNRENIVGTGGENNDYKLWDTGTKQCIFKAKSLGHDYLQLPIPTSVRGISFFNNEPNLGVCCTKEGHVLLYDDRAQRRPIITFFEEKASYTSISSVFGNTQVFVGTTKGYMQWLDLRKTSKVLKTYTKFAGAVTDIVCDPFEPYVASVSLDRYLRIHKMDTKEIIHKLYMKQSLTKLLAMPIIKDEEPEKSKVDVDQEYEDLFSSMEKVQDDTTKKEKRKTRGQSEQKVKKKKIIAVKPK